MSSKNILANSPSIIYQFGGVAGGLVVTTWDQVKKFIASRQGSVIVYIDDSLTAGAGCPVPGASGITDVGRVEFRSIRQDNTDFSTFVVQNGATLKNLYKVSGTVFLELQCRGAVPCLDFDYTPGAFGNAIPIVYFEDRAALADDPTGANTNPSCVVPAGQQLQFHFTTESAIFYTGPAPIVHVLGGALFGALCLETEIVNLAGGIISPTWVDGPGTGSVGFDSVTVKSSLGKPTTSCATALTSQLDTQQLTATFLATAGNVLGTFQASGLLPPTGSVHVQIEGCGGSGGGGGGQGGGAVPGVGGGGSGGSQYQVGSFDHDLAHPLNINISAAAAGGPPGAAGGGFGSTGANGGPSEASDPITNITLFVLQGSNGGQGGGLAGGTPGRGGATYVSGGAGTIFIPNITDVNGPPYGSGFIAAGGMGGVHGVAGSDGQRTLAAALVTGGGNFWGPGTGGTSGVGQGGGGGGGGAGPFAPAGPGGNGAAVGSNPGGGAAPNSGAGVGGGSGGAGAGDPGGVGANGTTGLVRLSLIGF